MRVALHSVLKEGHETDYDDAHQRIPDDLAASFKRVGIYDWSIWRSGRNLFHLVDCEDFAAAMNALADDPADRRWQSSIGRFIDHFERHAEGPEGMVLAQVWQLTLQE